MSLRLLIVDDSEDDVTLLVFELRKGGIDPDFMRVETPPDLAAALDCNTWDAVIANYDMPAFTCLDAQRIIQAKGLDLPLILVSGVIGNEKVVEALKSGANDLIMKEDFSRLVPALERALQKAIIRQEQRQAEEELYRNQNVLERRICQITAELERAKDALRQAQQQSESILASVADSHILFDWQWHILYVNKAAAQAMGRPVDQILGHILWELYPDIVGTEVDRQYHRAMDDRLPIVFVYHYSATDTWWENRIYPTHLGLSVFSSNITARKKAEEAVLESEKRFRSYFELGLVGTAITSPAKDFLEFNDKMCEIFGYERNELKKMSWVKLVHPDDLAADLANFNRILAGDTDGYMMENRYIRKDGRVICAALAVKCLRRPDGSVEYCMAHLQDITELRQTVDSLRRYAQRLTVLEETMRRKLATELHDELGRDLAALCLNFTILSNFLSRNAREKLGNKIADSNNMLEEMGRKVRSMMAMLRPPILDDFGLVAALRSHAELFAKRAGIAVDLQLEEIEPRPSGEIELAFFRIAQEALNNVSKHAKATYVTLRLGRYEGKVRLTVSDDGHGFDPQRNKPSDSGSGWGLTIMRERAESVGAHFSLDSRPDHGTVIFVETGKE